MRKDKVYAKGFKGFNKGLICLNKQYKENTIFEEKKAKICVRGMHFCKRPLDVLNYYPIVNNDGSINEYAEVEALDKCFSEDESERDDSKVCTKKLKIKNKLTFMDLFRIEFEMLKEEIKEIDNKEDITYSKDNSAKIGSSGDSAKIGSSGYSAQIGSSGDSAKIGSSGYSAKIGSSGDYAQIGSSGDYAQIGSSGDYAKIGSSGDYAQIGSSGDSAKIGSSGYSAKIGSSGDYAQIGSSGDYAQIGSSGDYAKIILNGHHSVGMCAGKNSMIKGKKGNWITLAEWKFDNELGRSIPICVKSAQIDGVKLKENTFYRLENGDFVEVEVC